ncbi:MAG: B12-binding domain-containing radical SAM protein [Deltaproteobacteria bacterium]|nr:B12-binding domain-containing radical SAM protein [Deltaproteobacteria bacterium]MBI3755885.1 B12-binding domain-containing radical SAM protein [Deltaproteobacteria bacterium]
MADKKKLLLISPLASKSLLGGDFYFRLPTLGLLKVAALTPPDWKLKIIDEKVEPLDLNESADLVGITAMTPAVTRAYEIADDYRVKGIKVVMGGMHASKLPQEALQHCDSIVIGEAEGLWPNVLDDFKKGELKSIYKHVTFPSLANLPIPDWNIYRDKKYLPVHFVETTRGCPHDCEFCSVTNSFGGKFRNRPIDEVEKEIQNLKPFDGRFTLKNVVFFVDDNIISNKTYAKEFLRRIIPYNLKWLGQTSVNIVRDDEILDLCRKSGCMGLLIGFESLSHDNLSKMGKGFNKPQNYFDVIKKVHDYGIGINGSFVFGFDHDNEGVFERTVEFTIKAKLEIAYFSILTPYPGTVLYEQFNSEGRIIDRDWSRYNTNNVVFKPKCMSPEELLYGYYDALKYFHSYSSIYHRLWGTTSKWNFFLPMNLGFRQTIKKTVRHGFAGNGDTAGTAI